MIQQEIIVLSLSVIYFHHFHYFFSSQKPSDQSYNPLNPKIQLLYSFDPKFIQYFPIMQKNTASSMKDFQILTKLGEGAFGVVFKVKRKEDGEEYALKKVKIGAMKEKERENAVNEIRILASLDYEHIIGFKDCFYDETTSTLCIVMEFAAGGDLLKKVSNHTRARTKFPEEEIWKALIHMSKGLKSLHDSKILHRDLKCANVFITKDGKYKLGDLNVSKVLKKDMANTQIGTPYYASPQVWQDLPYDMKSDIWSLGCVVYEMCALKPPFQAADLQGLYKKVKAGIYERIPTTYSNELNAIIGMMLKVNPKLRPSVDDILTNSIVAKNYKEGLLTKQEMDEKGELLQTIKFNPFNLRALKDKLPKSNYDKEESKMNIITEQKEKQKVEVKEMIKESRPSVSSLEKDRQRMKSAGNIRAKYESPKSGRKEAEPRKQTSKSKAAQKPVPLPPKAPYQPGYLKPPQQNQPPKPPSSGYGIAPPSPTSKDNISKSKDNIAPTKPGSSRDNSREVEKPASKDKPKPPDNAYEKYLKAGGSQQKSNNPIQRPSSAYRVQPSWWG